jgi:hypothetical protein
LSNPRHEWSSTPALKILWHNKVWSDNPDNPAYKPYPGVDEPRDLTVVADIIVNVQTGTGNRIEFWDRPGPGRQRRQDPPRDRRAHQALEGAEHPIRCR